MPECVYLGVSETVLTSRPGTHSRCSSRESSAASVAEQLSSLLEIKAITLQSTTSRHQSRRNGKKLHKNSEPDRHLHQGEVFTETTVRDHAEKSHGGRPRSKCPHVEPPRLVRRLSQATILDQFQELTLARPKTNSSPQYFGVTPPPEYIHRCLPVSYRLKKYPITTAQSNVVNIYKNLRFGLSSRPLLQAPHHWSERGSGADQGRRSSTFKHYPAARMVAKTPRKLISIACLSLKGIPKVRS